jgi:hypothetical protein
MNNQKFTISKKEIFLDENGSVIYKGINLEVTPNQIFDARINIGITTETALEIQYQSIIEKRRNNNLEILLD